MKAKFIISLLLLLSLCSSAMAIGLPFARLVKNHRCSTDGVSYSNDLIVINSGYSSKVPTIYVFHNTSDQAYWLDHRSTHPSASAGWGSEIDPGHWSAILMDDPNFMMTCYSISTNKQLNCQQVVHTRALKMPEQMLPSSHYWLAENKDSMRQLKQSVRQSLAAAQ